MSEIEQTLRHTKHSNNRSGAQEATSNQIKVRRFEAVILQHMDAAYNLARWLARNDHDAEDIAQEAGLRAFRFLDGFSGDNARAWLLTIVRNTYYSWLTRNRERQHDEAFEEDRHDHAAETATMADSRADGSPEQFMLEQASKQIVDTALARLPADARAIIVLRELEELSYRQIADVAGIPLGTVMSRLARARRLLREQLIRRARAGLQ